jgi:hypothetical protein
MRRAVSFILSAACRAASDGWALTVLSDAADLLVELLDSMLKSSSALFKRRMDDCLATWLNEIRKSHRNACQDKDPCRTEFCAGDGQSVCACKAMGSSMSFAEGTQDRQFRSFDNSRAPVALATDCKLFLRFRFIVTRMGVFRNWFWHIEFSVLQML